MRGVYLGNASMVNASLARIYNEVVVESQSLEGIQHDGSFHQHGTELLAGSYGAVFSSTILGLLQQTSETAFYMPPHQVANLVSLIIDGQSWMTVGSDNIWDIAVAGRQMTRPPGTSHVGFAPMALRNVTSPRKAELEAFAARLGNDPGAVPLVGHRHFWDSDYSIQRQATFQYSVRMYSNRTVNARCVNSEVSLT
jgi:chondroitin AC lyase